jgi:putative DNA primase/helicase
MENNNYTNPVDSGVDIIEELNPSQEHLQNNAHLGRILEYLEPIEFGSVNKKSVYDTFLNNWSAHVREKLNGKQEPFDFESLSKAIKADGEQKVRDKDYKVIASEVILKTADLIGHRLMYQMDKFFVYNGTHWQFVSDAEMNEFIRASGIRMGIDRMLAPDADFIQRMIKQLSTTVTTPVKSMMRDIMNFQNCTLEIHSDGRVVQREHRPTDYLHYTLAYNYDPKATCPKWQQFLDEVIPEPEKQANLAEFLGSCFSNVKHEKILLLYGTGANGKSVVLVVVTDLFGKTNLVHNTLEEITDERGYFRGNLMTALLNFAGEISDKVNPDGLKKLASREPMNGRYVWGRPFEVKDYCRSAFNCNVLPKVKEASDGYFRRFLIIPFEVTIPEDRRDPELPATIIETDLPGIMNWVIAGLQRLLKNNGKFTHSPASESILKQYMESSMNVSLFVQDVIGEQKGDFQSSKLYSEYLQYCSQMEYSPVNTKEFSIQLRKAGLEHTRTKTGVVYRVG